MSTVTMKQMLEAGVHFGHQTKRWNPKMKPYIFGARNGIYIIDLQQTVTYWRRAYDFICDLAGRGEKVLFVGTKKQAQDVIADEATRSGMFFVNNRWLGGTMTNWQTVKKSIDRLVSLERARDEGRFDVLSKKEGLQLSREIAKMDKNLGGIKTLKGLPSVIFVVDPKKEHIAVREANVLKIPVVALCDTNCDPSGIEYVVPGNDDAIKSIRLFVAAIADAAIEGRQVSTGRAQQVAVVPSEGAEAGVEVVKRHTPVAAEEEAPAEAT